MTQLMGVFQASDLNDLATFPKRQDQLAILERDKPEAAQLFFEKLMENPFAIAGAVYKNSAEDDIRDILANEISNDLQEDAFYNQWVSDMAEVCKNFSETLEEDGVTFWLGSQRGCRRYHIDNVPLRALVTYAGKGTEWVPDEAADRAAFANGARNETIVKDPSAICFMNSWDVAVFRGGEKGLLHRTPDAALGTPSSILMRLDHLSFWENVLKPQNTPQIDQ